MKEVLRQRWITVLLAERRSRHGHTGDDDARGWLMQKLDEMAQRARADPNTGMDRAGRQPLHFVEPTEEQRRRGLAEIEGWLRERSRMQS